MKSLIKYIVFVLFFFNLAVVNAEEIAFEQEKEPEKKEDITTISNREYDFSEYMVLLARYFNNHYAGDKIDEDLTDDLQKFFPNMNNQELLDAQYWIRWGVKVYREGVKLYNNLATAITAKPTSKIFPDEDYDDDRYYDYIDTGKPDEYIVITDIKRVLAYGNNKQDIALMQAKKDHDAGIEKGSILDEFKKLKKLWDEGRYRELILFGAAADEKQQLSGIGKEIDYGNVKTSLVANLRGIMQPDNLKIGILVFVPNGKFISAENSKSYFAPQVVLEDNDNIEFYKVLSPVPTRFNRSNGESFGVYGGVFVLPIEIKLKENTKEITLQAKAKFQVCDLLENCQTVETDNELYLNDKDNYVSEIASFIEQAFTHLHEDEEIFGLEKAVIDEDEKGRQSVRLEFFNHKKVRNFDVFIENEEKTEFKAPVVAVNGNNIFVRFEPTDDNQKFQNKEFYIRALLNRKFAYEKTVEAKSDTLFDPKAMTFSLGLLALAFLGGILLNFMPCVFPVLSLKIIAISKMKSQNTKQIKRDVFLNICGIIGGFLLLAGFLSVLKLLGYSLGWGMQFQNVGFLGIMMFVVLLFWAELAEYIDIKTPEFINKYLSGNAKKNDFLNIMTGAFVVLMATPCSAPFLGIAVGFALGGTILHIYLVLMAVALGLCLPYMLILLLPEISCKLPNDMKWRRRFVLIMEIMLFATLLWLSSIMSAQIGVVRTMLFLLILCVIIWIISISHRFIEFIKNDKKEKKSVRDENINFSKKFFLVFCSIFAVIAFSYLYYAHVKGENEYALKNIPEHIDFSEIKKQVQSGKIVVLEVGANWCLTCKVNDIMSISALKRRAEELDVVYIRVDWSRYNKDILEFMAKYGRRGLPFYVVYTKAVPDGIAMPEILTLSDLEAIIGKTIMY